MSNERQLLLAFFDKCNELKSCKFIMATTKMKDVLKSIVNSQSLYTLFEYVTKDFNYPKVKAECLFTVNDGSGIKNLFVLPDDPMQALAFIFCLLVEFDKESINFNDFLRCYFPEGGNYFTSYSVFCDTVIDRMTSIVATVFEDELKEEPPAMPKEQSLADENVDKGNSEAFVALLAAERNMINEADAIPQQEKPCGLAILDCLAQAFAEGNGSLANALIGGYYYYVTYHNCVSEQLADLIKMVGERGDKL